MKNPSAPRFAVLIPTFNNARTLGSVVERSLASAHPVLVVDDGSTDGTQEVLAAFADRIRLERHARNRGKGFALRTGFAALAPEFDYAITVDADGQHYPEDVPSFVEAIEREPGALAVGERDMLAAGAPRRSCFGLWFSNFSLRKLGGVRLRDSQAGFRAYPLARVRDLALRGSRYDLELEVLIKAARAGIPLLPVPIQCSYEPEGGRVSHFRPVRDFCQIGGQVLRLLRNETRPATETDIDAASAVKLASVSKRRES